MAPSTRVGRVIAMLVLSACRPAASSAPREAGGEAAAAPVADAVVDAAAEDGAQEPLAIDEARYCSILERAADEAGAQARVILADREPSIYEADILRYTAPGPKPEDPRVAALLRAEGTSEHDLERFVAANASAVDRCRERYAARLASYGDLFARLEAIGAQSATFRASVARVCMPFERLQRPVVLYDEEEANCGRQIAVDGAGGIWHEGGCENGAPPFCRDEKLTANGSARYLTALDRLRRAHPRVGDGGAPDCTGTEPEFIAMTAGLRRRTFELLEPSGAAHTWQLCPGAKLPRVFQDVLDVVR